MSESEIRALAQRLNMSYDEVKKRVLEAASTKFATITDEKKRMTQAFIYTRAKLLAKPPGKDVKVIVYGLREPINKASRKVARVYVIIQRENLTKAVVVLADDLASEYKNANLFTQYTINVNDIGKEMLMANPMTRFEGGKQVSPEKVLEILKMDQSHFMEFKINEAPNYLSTTKDSKYVDEFDLRATTGIITRANFKKNDKGEIIFSVYELADPEDPEQIITAWVPPPLFKYGEGSLLYMYGTLVMTKDNIVQFQVQGIIPKEAVPLTEV